MGRVEFLPSWVDCFDCIIDKAGSGNRKTPKKETRN